MNNLARILLMMGALVLALLVGVLIGRGQHAETTAGNAPAVQITTTTAPPPMAPVTPLPAPVQAPAPIAAAPKATPDLQVQEDAAAVGMTTRDAPAPAAPPPAKTATDAGGNAQPPG
jgi:hypothetical protein